MKKYLVKTGVICFWTGVWWLVAALVNSFLLPTPPQVINALWQMLTGTAFYRQLSGTLLRVMLGFPAAFACAVLLSGSAFRSGTAAELISPLMQTARSVPVACLSVLMIMWVGGSGLGFAVVMLVAVPVIYTGLYTALKRADASLLEMAKIYGLTLRGRIKGIYLFRVEKELLASSKLALSMSFKAGIAAEVIAIVPGSVGEGIYLTKLYLDMDRLIAWAAVIMLISFAAEKLFGLLYGAVFKALSAYRPGRYTSVNKFTDSSAKTGFTAACISKSYGDRSLFEKNDISVTAPGLYAVVGQTGSGKTTLLKIIAGLDVPDSGQIRAEKAALAFQETRLIEKYSAAENVLFTMDTAAGEADITWPEGFSTEEKAKTAQLLSGGERKTCEVVRALCSGLGLVLLDEPFAGLDDASARGLAALIKQAAASKTVIVTVHEAKKAEEIGAEVIFSLDCRPLHTPQTPSGRT